VGVEKESCERFVRRVVPTLRVNNFFSNNLWAHKPGVKSLVEECFGKNLQF